MAKMKALITCLIFAIGLLGCSPMSSSDTGGNPNNQEYPSQGSPFPSIISTPIASKGTVIGTLVSAIPEKSIAGLALYFGTVLPLTPGPDHLVTMNPVDSSKAIIRDDGSFVAENIIPGEYVLILWTPHDSRYVPDPNNPEQDFIVEVVAGQIINIGTLQVPPPP